MAAMPLLILGLILNTSTLVTIGIAAFGLSTLFQLLTLPVGYLLGFTLGMGAQGLILGFTVGLTTAAVLLIVRYRRDIRRWKAGIR